jgi:hypothetical protein
LEEQSNKNITFFEKTHYFQKSEKKLKIIQTHILPLRELKKEKEEFEAKSI